MTKNRARVNSRLDQHTDLGPFDGIDVEAFAKSLEVLRPDGSPRPIQETPPLCALAGEVVINQEELVRTPATGELRCRQVSSSPVRDAKGNVIGSVSVVRDITERKKMEEELLKIFDPYFSTKQKGSGLGLATVYSIVKKHDGHITVDSETGVGTTFTIYLPASEEELAESREVEGELIEGHGRILVMDDEASIRNFVKQSLHRLGYEVELAADGKEAIEKCGKVMPSQNPFDAVILDLTIPGAMGGKDCIQRLKEIDPGVKAIVASGYADDPVMADFREYGFTSAVAKPFNIEKLSQALHHVVTGP